MCEKIFNNNLINLQKWVLRKNNSKNEKNKIAYPFLDHMLEETKEGEICYLFKKKDSIKIELRESILLCLFNLIYQGIS